MELIYPSYYKDFRCIADKCPDSCCHEWDVQVDPESAAFYRTLTGPLGNTLRRAMYEDEGETYLRNQADRCPMWREDGLCQIQAELGHDALCQTCRDFPRLRQDYGDFLELGLEMSCPEAAKIMLTSHSWHLISEPHSGGEEPDYDPELMSILRRTRPQALSLLTDSRFTVSQRLALLLMYGYHVQAEIDGSPETPFDPIAALGEACQFSGIGSKTLFTKFYQDLEILTHRWNSLLEGELSLPIWSESLCRQAQYGIYRYYYQAVSDWDLVCRIKLVVSGCILTAHLGGTLEVLQLYSKEIENDASNVDAILDGAYCAPALTDANLLSLLLK